jgi:hypothetical protein
MAALVLALAIFDSAIYQAAVADLVGGGHRCKPSFHAQAT